jgi:hypothetical protein
MGEADAQGFGDVVEVDLHPSVSLNLGVDLEKPFECHEAVHYP